MARRVEPNGEALVWCRKCSEIVRENARRCLGWKLVNPCRPDERAHKSMGRIQFSNEKQGGFSKGWNIEVQEVEGRI